MKCYVCKHRFGIYDKVSIREKGHRVLVYHASHDPGGMDSPENRLAGLIDRPGEPEKG